MCLVTPEIKFKFKLWNGKTILKRIIIEFTNFTQYFICIFQVNYLTNEYTKKEMPESAWCAVPWNENAKAPLYLMISSTFVAFVIPFSLVMVLYFR